MADLRRNLALGYRILGMHGVGLGMLDRNLPATLTIDDGDVVDFDCPSIFDWGPNATVDDLKALDLGHPHIITGPVAVRGAEPGDALAIDILDVRVTTQQGIVAFVPGFGLLADDFDEFHVHVVRYVDTMAEIKDGVRVPVEPFLGIMGVAPAEHGEHSTIPRGSSEEISTTGTSVQEPG